MLSGYHWVIRFWPAHAIRALPWERGHLALVGATRAGRPRSQDDPVVSRRGRFFDRWRSNAIRRDRLLPVRGNVFRIKTPCGRAEARPYDPDCEQLR